MSQSGVEEENQTVSLKDLITRRLTEGLLIGNTMGCDYGSRHLHRDSHLDANCAAVLDSQHVIHPQVSSGHGLLIPSAAHCPLGFSPGIFRQIPDFCPASICRCELFALSAGHDCVVPHLCHRAQHEELFKILLHRYGVSATP